MKIDVAYGRDIDDSMLKQLMYMEADAYAYYDNLNSDANAILIGIIPTETLNHFKKRMANTLFLMKTKKEKSNRKLIAMACISKKDKSNDSRCFHTLYVKPLHRKKGIGTALVKRAISLAKKSGYSLSLGVNPLNKDAMHLYDSLGFIICKDQSLVMKFDVKRKKA